ncbi:MAG: hypothetical protein FH749_00290 [Firmicutes bacterium]|nr:hypothetical protein [Bacillota bacterium]
MPLFCMGEGTSLSEHEKFTIAQNLKILEELKVQLLSVIAELFSGLHRGLETQVLEALSGALVIIFGIARRAGISFRELDQAVEEKLVERVENPRNSLRETEQQILTYWRGKRVRAND